MPEKLNKSGNFTVDTNAEWTNLATEGLLSVLQMLCDFAICY